MQPFAYTRAGSLAEAIQAAALGDTALLAGGTEILNWMKEGISSPERLVDINGLPGLGAIEMVDGDLRIGALARMADIATHELVRRDYPAISQALLKSASPQLRNMASIGGNLMQRTRCPYFRAEIDLPCNKRRPGSGCSALGGEDRGMAIFGWSERCVATHPSDVAVAFAALDAVLDVQTPEGTRSIPIANFHRLPADEPHRDTHLPQGGLIVAIRVPASSMARRSHYLKLRERASYEFALVSTTVAVSVEDGIIRDARIALGGVAAKPWRLGLAEQALRGRTLADAAALEGSLEADLAEARPGRHNGFKIELGKRAVIRALQIAGGLA